MKKKFIKSSKKIFSLVLIFTLAIVLSTSQLSTALADEQSPNTTTLTQEDVNVPSEGNTGDKASDPKTEVPAESEAKADEAKTETNTPAESEVKPDEAKEETNTPAESEVKDDNANVQDTQENGAITENNEGLSIINQFAQVRTLTGVPVITDSTVLAQNIAVIKESDGMITGYASMANALGYIEAESASGGDFTIVLLKDYNVSAADVLAADANKGKKASMTITGVYNNGSTNFRRKLGQLSSQYLVISGNTLFKSIDFASGGILIFGNGKKVTIGDDVVTLGIGNTIYAGKNAAVTAAPDAAIIVTNGTWTVSGQHTGAFTGNVNLTISGPTTKGRAITTYGSIVGNFNLNVDGTGNPTIITDINVATGVNHNYTLKNVGTPASPIPMTAYRGTGATTVITEGDVSLTQLLNVKDVTLNDNSTLTVNDEFVVSNNLSFNAGSKLVSKGSTANKALSTKNLNILGPGAQLNVGYNQYGGSTLNSLGALKVTGALNASDPLKLGFSYNRVPIQGDIFITFTPASTADVSKFMYADIAANSGPGVMQPQGSGNIIYNSLILPGYSMGPMAISTSNSAIVTIENNSAHNAPYGKMSFNLLAFWNMRLGNLSTIVDGFNGNAAYESFSTGVQPNSHISVKVGGVVYKLTGSFPTATNPGFFRGYKISADGKSISMVFDLGPGVGIFYYEMGLVAGNNNVKETWQFENRSTTPQDILVTHGGDVSFAGKSNSYSITKAGTGVLFTDHREPAMYIYNETPNAAALSAIAGFVGQVSDNFVPQGLEYDNPGANTSVLQDTGFGLQWKFNQVPAGATQTGSGGFSVSRPGRYQFRDVSTILRNPNGDSGAVELNSTVLSVDVIDMNITTSMWKQVITNDATGLPQSGFTVIPQSPIGVKLRDTSEFKYTVKADLSVPPGDYTITNTIRINGEDFLFIVAVKVERDQYNVATVVNDKISGLPTTSVITDIVTKSKSPTVPPAEFELAGNNVYKYHTGVISWNIVSGYIIDSITVNGVAVSAADLETARTSKVLNVLNIIEDSDVVITVRETDPSLAISKVVTGDGSSVDDVFNFEITAIDKNGVPLISGTELAYTGSALTVDDTAPANEKITIGADGKGTFTLKHGQMITITEVPRDCKITVTEVLPNPTTYTASYSIDAATPITASVTSELIMSASKTVAFTNNDPVAKIKTLTISKIVTGDYANQKEDFTFTLTVVDKTGAPYTGVTSLPYTGDVVTGSGVSVKPTGGTFVLDAEGKATFTLKHGQKIIIAGVKSDSQVQVVETNVTGYNTTFTDSFDSATTKTGIDTGLSSMNLMDRTFDFMNARVGIVETGITNSNIGVITVISVATIALVFMLVASRRRRRG